MITIGIRRTVNACSRNKSKDVTRLTIPVCILSVFIETAICIKLTTIERLIEELVLTSLLNVFGTICLFLIYNVEYFLRDSLGPKMDSFVYRHERDSFVSQIITKRDSLRVYSPL